MQNECWTLENDSSGTDSRIPAPDGRKKMEKNHHALDTGGRDVKIRSDLGLERFQTRPKWEM